MAIKFMSFIHVFLSALVIIQSVHAAPGGDVSDGVKTYRSTEAAIKKAKVFSTFLSLIDIGGMDSYLQAYCVTHTPTLFLPTNDAMAKLSAAAKKKLADPQKLLYLTSFHMLNIRVSYSQLLGYKSGSQFTTLHGAPLTESRPGNTNRVVLSGPAGSAVVTVPNVVINEDIAVHGLDTVLLPPGW